MNLNTWSTAEIKKELELWLTRPGNESLCKSEPEDEIKSYLSGDTTSVSALAVDLLQLSVWYSTQGVVSLLDGKLASLDDLSRSFQYDFWDHLIMHALFYADTSKGRGPRLSFNDAGLLLSQALTLGSFSQAELVAHCAIRGISSGAYYSLDNTRLTPFILRLFYDWRSLPAPRSLPLAERAYQSVLEQWKSEDNDELRLALSNACDFHIQRSKDDTSAEAFEFHRSVYRIYPVEILAVLRLREQLGLTVAKVDHPLMNSPLGELYDTRALPNDPMLDRLTDKLKKDLPSLQKLIGQP